MSQVNDALWQVKIQGQNKEMLLAACQQFLGRTENEVRAVATETLEGHQRAIMGNMTVEVVPSAGNITLFHPCPSCLSWWW